MGNTAMIYTLLPNATAWSVIAASAQGLYDWQHPRLPEDLCFLRRDGSPWLGTVAHERDAFLDVDDSELVELLAAVPQLSVGKL